MFRNPSDMLARYHPVILHQKVWHVFYRVTRKCCSRMHHYTEKYAEGKFSNQVWNMEEIKWYMAMCNLLSIALIGQVIYVA